MGKILGYWLYAENVLMVDFNREIQLEIDRSGSFISLHPNPFPAFPAAIYTPSKFMGTAISQLFLPAVRQYTDEKVGGDPSEAFRLALDQAKRELSRNPNLVIASASDHDGTHFNYLDWLEKDDGFRELWKNYQFYRVIGPLLLYRRIPSAPAG